jgi:Tol biopolymer transport system component
MLPLSGKPYNVPLPAGIAVAGGTGLTWMPDNRSVVFATYLPDTFGTHIVAFNTETKQIRRLTEGFGNEMHPHVSHDGARLAFTSGDTDVDLVEFSVADARKPKSILATSFAEDWPDWSPSGDMYAFSRTGTSGRSKLYARGIRDGWERPLLDRESQNDQHSYNRPRFSPDGQRIAYERSGPEGHIVHVAFVAGSRPARIDRESEISTGHLVPRRAMDRVYAPTERRLGSSARPI